MSLLEQINERWTKKTNAQALATKWAADLKDRKADATKWAGKFRELSPLRAYFPVTNATQPTLAFSLRYLGQHVGNVVIRKDRPVVVIHQKTALLNSKYFDLEENRNFVKGVDLEDPQVSEFIRRIRKIPTTRTGRIQEHRIESLFLDEMERPTKSKFGETLQGIQPVLFGGCPFQLPVPISGSKGKPELSKGNTDIVARRGHGRGVRISIWELKSPGVEAHAIEQAYIYGMSLMRMLRSKDSGHIWYRDIFGFSGKVPDRLKIECVAAVSLGHDSKREAFEAKCRRFVQNNDLSFNGDSLEFYVAHYKECPGLEVDLRSIPKTTA